MSCRQEMYGEYIIPAKGWAKFKKDIMSAYNQQREVLIKSGNCLYEEFKGKKILSLEENDKFVAITDEYYRIYQGIHCGSAEEFMDLVCKDEEVLASSKVCKPTQAMADKLMPKAKNTSTKLSFDGWGVGFDNKTRVFGIWINESNRGVDNFFKYSNKFTTEIFRALDKVQWSRNSGGEIKHVSESFDDGPCAERDVTEYTHLMGPIGEKNSKHRHEYHFHK